MSKNSKWSVVITSYGVGRRIERAVQSVLEQTVEPVELVVIDDDSNDAETLEGLDRLTGLVEIQRLSERGGAGAARNIGMATTNNPFVLCLDGDDWIEPTYLESAQAVFEDRPEVGIVSAWVRFEGERTGEWRPEEFDLVDLLATNQISSASTFRREASEAVGYYAENLFGYEDWDHWIAIASRDWKVHVIAQMQIHYEWRSGSFGQRSDRQARRLVQQIVSRHERLFRENIGPILGALRERILILESGARSAWLNLQTASQGNEKAWRLVTELGNKLELQAFSVEKLTQELERTQQIVLDLEAAGAAAKGQGNSICGPQNE